MERASAGLGGLRPEEGRAWSALLRAHATLVAEMERELEQRHGVVLTTYDVLRQLALAGGRLRMAELADRVMLSRPGLTGVVKRLEAGGLLERHPVEDDGRGLHAVLTPAGERVLAEVHGTHVASIRERFARQYTREELVELAGLLERLSTPAGRDAAVQADVQRQV
jgi:DNA-binding MarR family transcriptional regulator